MVDELICFGSFSLYPRRRVLFGNGNQLRLGSRALELLLALIMEPGKVLSKEVLLARVWPSSVVEEANLRVHIGALRKVLGDGKGGERYIESVPLRGYCFVAPITRTVVVAAESQDQSSDLTATQQSSNSVEVDHLPLQLSQLIGREEAVASLWRGLSAGRLVTLVGSGGIGKTSVAVALARERKSSYPDGVRFVDLAPLSRGKLVPDALAFALGIATTTEAPVANITAYLRNKAMLLVIDNCEHLLGEVAALIESILHQAAGVRILATSREPIRVSGELVQRLPPLPLPPVSSSITPEQAIIYPSVRLFVERAFASSDSFVFGADEVEKVCSLCRRLDGIPLAIELAAASISVFGLAELVKRLSDRFAILTRGRRTALARHQTLEAAIDWSYDELSDEEKLTLRRLSAFQGTFDSVSALSMYSPMTQSRSNGQRETDGLECLSNLVAKSLLSADVSGESVQYRLLEMTRAYAIDRATALDEVAASRSDHARHCCDLFEQADLEWTGQPTEPWMALYRHRIDDLRTALDWAFSADGDIDLGIALTSWSLPLWFALSSLGQYYDYVCTALAAMKSQAAPLALHEMRLNEGLGHAIWHTRVEPISMIKAFERARQLAREEASPSLEMRASWGLWTSRMTTGEYDLAMQLSSDIGNIAGKHGGIPWMMIHHRTMGFAAHMDGQHALGMKHTAIVQLNSKNSNRPAKGSGIQFDQRSMASALIARILWVQGFPDQAMQMAQTAMAQAMETAHSLSICFVVTSGAGIVPIWTGDDDVADEYATIACERADELSLTHWQTYAHGFKKALALRAKTAEYGEDIVAHNPTQSIMLADLLATLHPAFVNDFMVERVDGARGKFAGPEVLRVQGVREARANPASLLTAETLLRRSYEAARLQGALSWQLRSAMSLASLLARTARRGEGRAQLEDTYSRFNEGFATRDLMDARSLLDAL